MSTIFKIRKTDAVDGNWIVTAKEGGKELGTIVAKHNEGKKTTSYNQATDLKGETRNFASVRDAAAWLAISAGLTGTPVVAETEAPAPEGTETVVEPTELPVDEPVSIELPTEA